MNTVRVFGKNKSTQSYKLVAEFPDKGNAVPWEEHRDMFIDELSTMTNKYVQSFEDCFCAFGETPGGFFMYRTFKVSGQDWTVNILQGTPV